MDRQLFGTDGIRGRAHEYPLDETGGQHIGKAIGMHFAEPSDVVVLGWDPRESSPMLVQAVSDGLTAVGVHVERVGVAPTAAIAYLTQQNEAAKAGVMVTASHNPYTDNGVKIFSADGGKLPDDTESKLNMLIDSPITDRGQGKVTDARNKIKAYEDFLVRSFGEEHLYGTKLAIDCANGATSGIASHVFKRLSASPVGLFDQPDGKNINDHCGANDTARLRQLAIQLRVQAAVAFDGDGDRLVMVDERGRQLNGDHILYILAVSGKYDRVVGTTVSNMGLETALRKHDIELVRTEVGDRYVLEKLLADNLRLGGEQTGHIIMPELLQTSDAILAAVQVFKSVKESGKSLAEWYDDVPMIPQTLINLDLADKSIIDRPEVISYIEAQTAELGDHGRLLIRPSGTEAKLRIMVEADDSHQRAQRIADSIEPLLQN